MNRVKKFKNDTFQLSGDLGDLQILVDGLQALRREGGYHWWYIEPMLFDLRTVLTNRKDARMWSQVHWEVERKKASDRIIAVNGGGKEAREERAEAEAQMLDAEAALRFIGVNP
jgi:hypothetical protein